MASEGRIRGAEAFLIVLFLGVIGQAVLQAQFNKLPERDYLPRARLA